MRGWWPGCVGIVGPVKDSLTYRLGSQGRASKASPLTCVLCCSMLCDSVWDTGFLSFFLYHLLSSML